ncbi:MAG: hypothetical protein IJ527_07530 [Prevotella sp.]|nr:hypothetical protein [Prevotella sp.]
MKKYLLNASTVAAIVCMGLTVISCMNKSKAEPVAAAAAISSVETKTETAVAEDSGNTLSGYDPSDATAFGLVGPVKKVFTTQYMANLNGNKLQRAERIESDGNNAMTFNRQGLVTCDIFGSPYTYDSNGKFIKGRNANTQMERSPRGLIEKYLHQDNTDGGHWNSYTYEFKYDQEGRMTTYTYTGWEEVFEYAYTYEGDKVYPSGEEMDGQACADLFKAHITYRYTKFDERGNWTEREVYIVEEQGVDTGVDGGEPEMEITKTYKIETRKIEYYES